MTNGPDKMRTFEIFLGQTLIFNKNASKGHLLLGLLLILQEQVKSIHEEYDDKNTDNCEQKRNTIQIILSG